MVVVEGMNDVIRMEELQVAAIGLTSNKPTDTQIETLVRFAQQTANNRITLLPDCDEEGEAGFKTLLWKLVEHRVGVRLGISKTMLDAQFANRQPESITHDEWLAVDTNMNTVAGG